MREARAVLADLLASGLTAEQQLLVAELAMSAAAEVVSVPSETPEQRRRRIKSENNQRAYEARRAKEERLNSPESHLTSPESRPPEMDLNTPEQRLNQAALACVGDNKLTTIPLVDYTTLNVAGVLSDPPTRPELDALEATLRAEASPALNDAAPQLCNLAPIIALMRGKGGPPCDLNADVVPVIRGKAKSSRPGSVNTWGFFTKAIVEARDTRLRDTPNVTAIDDWRPPRKPGSGQQAEDEFEAARQRVIERFQ